MASKLKAFVLFGTRPDAIKLAPVIHELKARKSIDTIVCSSGQHKEMLSQVIPIFELFPNLELNVMTHSQTLASLSVKLLERITASLTSTKPNFVIVHGDTATALCGALASFYLRIPVIHVEAGLRTNDLSQPFPEEMNRQAISKIASLHFAPTRLALSNLLQENIPADRVLLSGNTIVDSLRFIETRIRSDFTFRSVLKKSLSALLPFNFAESKYVLITMHRRESFGLRLAEVCRSILDLAIKFPSVKFVFPVHLNPEVSEEIKRYLVGKANVLLVSPLAYDQFFLLLSKASLVITDSGGIQEEAVTLGKPTLVTREKTEREEALDTGLLHLVGANSQKIMEIAIQILTSDEEFFAPNTNPYGKGDSSKFIVDHIEKHFSNSKS